MRAAIVKGTVTFSDGRPAGGVVIYIAAQGHESGSANVQRVWATSGAFELPFNADCYCHFTAVSNDQVSRSETRLVRVGQPVEPVHLVLQLAGRVHGTLTIGKDNRPVTERQLSLYERPKLEYWELPKEQQQLPNPNGSRKIVAPRIVRSTNTDAMGSFTFFVAPGRYYLVGPANVKPVEFEMKTRPSFIVDLHQDRPERGEFACRVVLQSDPNHGVSEAKVEGYGTGEEFAILKGATDAEGRLHTHRALAPMIIQAKSKDGSFSGIIKIGPDDNKAVIPIGPTASVHGRLIAESSDKPVANRQIDFGVRVTYPNRSFSSLFSGSNRTDSHGEFTLTGLTVGWKFDLFVSLEKGSVLIRDNVLPQKGGLVEIGDLKMSLPVPRSSGLVAAKVPLPKRKPIYNEAANAKAEIEAALKTANRENKRVLLKFGGNWCGWCFKLHDVFNQNAEVSAVLNRGFVLVLVDVNANPDLFEKYAKDEKQPSFPYLVVLDADGKVVRDQKTDELEDGPKHDVAKVKAFLVKWSPLK